MSRQDSDVAAAQAVNMVHPMDITAIEIYRGPGQTPGEFLDSDDACGVILTWTRRGREIREERFERVTGGDDQG